MMQSLEANLKRFSGNDRQIWGGMDQYLPCAG